MFSLRLRLALLIPTLVIASPLPKRDTSICSSGGKTVCCNGGLLECLLSDTCSTGNVYCCYGGNYQGGIVNVNNGNCHQASSPLDSLPTVKSLTETPRGLISWLGGSTGGASSPVGSGSNGLTGTLNGLTGVRGGGAGREGTPGLGRLTPGEEFNRREPAGGLGGLTGALGGLTGGGNAFTGDLTGGQGSNEGSTEELGNVLGLLTGGSPAGEGRLTGGSSEGTDGFGL